MTEAPLMRGGVFDGTLAPTLGGVVIEGLELESTYIWGLFRTRGDEPHIVQVVRRLSKGSSWPPRLLLQSNFGANGMRRHYIELMSARSRDIESQPSDGGLLLMAAAIEGAQPFELAIDGESISWSEGQLLDVHGAEVTPGLQWWLVPGEDGNGMRFASRMFRVEGVFEETAVDGFVAVDQVHLAPGHEYYVDDPMTTSHVSRLSCRWATAYDDGSLECGYVWFGADGEGCALRAADGELHVSNDVVGEIVSAPDGCPAHVRCDIDGEAWEFVVDDRGMPIEPLPGPVRQGEGWFRRVGEQRRPVVWCARPELPSAT
jgi:hypothetical protein